MVFDITHRLRFPLGRVAMLASLCFMTFVPVARSASDDHPTIKVSAMSPEMRQLLEKRINVIANRIANRKIYFEDDSAPIHIKSSFDPVRESLIMDTDERLGPVSGYPEIEDLRDDVQRAIWPILEGIPGFWGLDWRYGGKDLYFWFPQDRVIPRKPQAGVGRASKRVLVSSGHGYYFHHGYSDWRTQRAPANGVLEDELTMHMASPLDAWLTIAGFDVSLTRESRFDLHEPSGKPYYMVSARYQLADRLPDRPDVWHSLPYATDALREYREDIRSRPLYANVLGVDAAIHVHTNADVESSRGTRVYYQAGRAESEKLGWMLLCYMGEQIHSIDNYKDFPVARIPNPGDHGENRLADMPSVIVEVGFHTNPIDAAALKDPIFIGMSTRGIAKGYRLYSEGKDCETFALNMDKADVGVVGQALPLRGAGTGYPDFPVVVEAKYLQCGAAEGCGNAYGVLYGANDLEGFSLNYSCRDSDVARSPFKLAVIARDSSGIETEPFELDMVCTKPAMSHDLASVEGVQEVIGLGEATAD